SWSRRSTGCSHRGRAGLDGSLLSGDRPQRDQCFPPVLDEPGGTADLWRSLDGSVYERGCDLPVVPTSPLRVSKWAGRAWTDWLGVAVGEPPRLGRSAEPDVALALLPADRPTSRRSIPRFLRAEGRRGDFWAADFR